MKSSFIYPSKENADKILLWASEQNPGPWIDHCKVAARIAETIAGRCGMETERAYVSGLMHDIGYYDYRNGKGRTCHIFTGYELMMERKWESIAKICLSHSFPFRNVKAYGGTDFNCNEEQLNQITTFLSETEYDDYDKLIQLCDTLGSAQGVCILEKRNLNVVMRSGFNEFTVKKWDSFFALKDYFDSKCDANIYTFFYEEICKTSLLKYPY